MRRHIDKIKKLLRTERSNAGTAIKYIILFSICIFFIYLLAKNTNIEAYHRLTGTLIILFFAVMLFSVLSSQRRRKIVIPDENIKEEVYHIIDLVEAWKNSNIIFFAIHYFLSGLTVYCSIVTVYIAGSLPSKNMDIILYSILSVFIAFVNLLLKLKEHAYGYRAAYEKASNALRDYLCGFGAWKDVLKAVAEGERMIGHALYKDFPAVSISPCGKRRSHTARRVKATIIPTPHKQHSGKTTGKQFQNSR